MKWFQKKKDGFLCPVCGQVHEGLPTDFGHRLPDEAWNQPEEKRREHLEWATDICYYEGDWYIRGVIEVPFGFQAGSFGWGVWARLAEDGMKLFSGHYQKGQKHDARVAGVLSNKLPYYEDTTGLPLLVQFGPVEMRPLFFVDQTGGHLLEQDQKAGLSAAAYHDILAIINPSP